MTIFIIHNKLYIIPGVYNTSDTHIIFRGLVETNHFTFNMHYVNLNYFLLF